MKFIFKMETALIAISGLLCTLLLVKLIYSLRSILLWRVNCWFCDNNFWVKYLERNFWTCPRCEQYNGFTKDGDYNRPIDAAAETSSKTPKVFHGSPKNGLCKMCNINQQLKVAQLANFVAMNEKNFDEEVEGYRLKLDKAYKLCSPCRKVLQNKLHKEKESFLGSKLLQSRSPEKTANRKQETQKKTLKNLIDMATKYVAVFVLILVSLECYRNMMTNNALSHTITNIWQILSSLFERIVAIIKMKLVMTVPDMEIYFSEVDNLYKELTSKYMTVGFEYDAVMNLKTQEALAAFAGLKIIGSMWNVKKLNFSFFTDLLWVMFLISLVLYHYLSENQLIISFVKLIIISTMLLVYRSIKTTDGKHSSGLVATKNMKNLANGSNTLIDDDDQSMETDDDISLCQFGLHNLSESSNDSPKQINNSIISGKAFNPRLNESIWAKTKNDIVKLNSSFINGRNFTPQNNNGIWSNPKFNSTFCVNSLLTKTPRPVSESAFVKPTISKCHNFDDDVSDDSNLDDSISSLCISGAKKSWSKKNNSIFSLRKFTATPSFAVPTPLNRKPLISPSKLGHSTSWVAGGYWGSDERQVFSVDGSRSSSQSSGFESQTSSNTQRNVFSQPPSREQSVCGESDRTVLDQFSNCSVSTRGPQKFAHVSSPVFPQMQYNSYVHIPQARFAQSQNMFAQHQQQYDPKSPFKAPSRPRSNLQPNPFLSR